MRVIEGLFVPPPIHPKVRSGWNYNIKIYFKVVHMLYILTSIMVLRTPNIGQNMLFLVFHMKK